MIASASCTKPKMTAAPVEILQERAEARALLWAAGEIENLPDAVDPLQAFALESGLVADIGQEAVQRILAEAFAPHRGNEFDDSRGERPAITSTPKARPTPQVTIEAIMWCVRERGPRALQEPENMERLNRCDQAAISEIDRGIAKLEANRCTLN